MIDEKKLIKEISELMMYRAGLFSPRYFAFKEILNLIKCQPKVGEWIPFTVDEGNILDCELPDEGDEILVSSNEYVWKDIFMCDGDGCFLESGDDLIGLAWMPLPEPWEEYGGGYGPVPG